jgi:DNA-binding response OmpR family regulator
MELAGLNVLVLEDEPIIAMALEDHLDEAGACPLVAGSIDEARRILAERQVDAAVLDINVHGLKSYPVAEALSALGVPYVFASGYGDTVHERAFVGIPTVTKPYDIAVIRRAFDEAAETR